MKSFDKFIFKQLYLLGKPRAPWSDFWVLTGLLEKTPTLSLPRAQCLGETFLTVVYCGKNFEHALKAVAFLKPAPHMNRRFGLW